MIVASIIHSFGSSIRWARCALPILPKLAQNIVGVVYISYVQFASYNFFITGIVLSKVIDGNGELKLDEYLKCL